jgi:hypothetical protein
MKFVNFLLILSIFLYYVESLNLYSKYLKADTLSENERLESDSNKYFVIMQSDGNLVVYSTGQTNGRGRDFPIWASNTNGKGSKPFRAVMQKDGNFVVYDGTNSPKWASNTNGRANEPFNLIMQDDGNLVLYAKDNKPIWASNTMGKR